MNEVLPTLVVLAVGAAIVSGLTRGTSRRERSLIALSMLAHVLSSFAQVWITRYVYGYGDMLTYHWLGTELAALVRYDPIRFGPELVTLVFQGQPQLPLAIHGAGGATGTMTGISGVLCLILNDSLYASCVLLSLGSMLGKFALYLAFRQEVPARLHLRVLVATMLVPSAVFWTAGIAKETILMIGLGPLLLGSWSLQRAPTRASAWALAVVGFLLAAIVKAYVLFAVVLALAGRAYWMRALARSGGRAVRVRPGYLLLASLGALGGVVGLGQMFPQYSVEHVAEYSAHLQEVGARLDAGSNYALIESEQRGTLASLAYAPIALLTSLYRPLFVEVRSAIQAVNALEQTALLVLTARILMRHRWKRLWEGIRLSPLLVFCLVFTAVFGTAVGLASTNLGSLSRYRAPMMPFFVALLLLLPKLAPAARKIARPTPRRRG